MRSPINLFDGANTIFAGLHSTSLDVKAWPHCLANQRRASESISTTLRCLVAAAIAFLCCRAAVAQSVPRWDARGVGLPQQAIACLDVAADGSQIVVGTFASPGDPD